MNPIHIVTDKKNIASRVLLPGDPLRAKYIAENYLENAELINTVILVTIKVKKLQL